MDPLEQFISELEKLLESKGYSITAADDINLHQGGKLIGYWPSSINVDNFWELE
jgi:hypothetical protein